MNSSTQILKDFKFFIHQLLFNFFCLKILDFQSDCRNQISPKDFLGRQKHLEFSGPIKCHHSPRNVIVEISDQNMAEIYHNMFHISTIYSILIQQIVDKLICP